MKRDRILYQVNEDEIDKLLDFCKQNGFDNSRNDRTLNLGGDWLTRTWFSKEEEGDRRVGYIEHDPEPYSYKHTLNIPAGGSFEKVVEDYRKLQIQEGVRLSEERLANVPDHPEGGYKI